MNFYRRWANLKIRHEYPELSQAALTELFKARAAQLLGEYERYVSDHHWEGENTLIGTGHGVRAELKVLTGAIEVEVKLPFMLRPLRGKIEQVVRRQLDKLPAQ